MAHVASRPFFRFHKSVQAIAFLLRRERSRRMNYMRLLKILYVAERESLGETGHALIGDRVLAMERGPVLESVYQLIRGMHAGSAEWSRFFLTDHYELELREDPAEIGELSTCELEKLEQVARRHQDDDERAMVKITHQLPEWKRNDPGESWKEIPLQDILEAVGRGSDVQEIIEECETNREFQQLFGS